MLASHKGKNIASAVYFHFGDKAIYKYGASDRKYQHLRANNLVMWEAIRWFFAKWIQGVQLWKNGTGKYGALAV